MELKRKGPSVAGSYFGLEREGEHGLFYTAVEVTQLLLSDEGELSFVVPARKLFGERPASIEAAQRAETASFTRRELRMKGRIEDGRLRLSCSAEFAHCPDRELVFKRGPW